MSSTLSTLSTLALSLSWCDEDRDLFGLPSRPLSLVSHHLLRLMGSRVLQPDPGYASAEDELRDMTLYTWLHTAALDEVCEAMWSGAWRGMLAVEMDPLAVAETLPEWRDRRQRLAALCAAVDYELERKPPRESTASTTPPPQPRGSMLHPTRLARHLRVLMRETGASRTEAKWEYPYWEAIQICHDADYYEGHWTVAPGERVGPVEFGEFALAEE
jgi:hypothetical protein